MLMPWRTVLAVTGIVGTEGEEVVMKDKYGVVEENDMVVGRKEIQESGG